MRWSIRLRSSKLYDCVTNQQLLLKNYIIIFVLKVAITAKEYLHHLFSK